VAVPPADSLLGGFGRLGLAGHLFYVRSTVIRMACPEGWPPPAAGRGLRLFPVLLAIYRFRLVFGIQVIEIGGNDDNAVVLIFDDRQERRKVRSLRFPNLDSRRRLASGAAKLLPG